jgi:putative ABC transport system permease protein
LTPQQARSAALRQLGGVEQIKEECRDVKTFPAIETLVQDFRFAVRTFRRRSGFAFAALSILAFGIGSSTAIFSVVNGVLLNPLPYREPQRLVRLFGVWEQGAREGISPPDFLDYRNRARMFESLAAASNFTPLLNLKGNGAPEQIQSRNVTAGFLRTLGIQPLLGREFNARRKRGKARKPQSSPTACGGASSEATLPSSAGRSPLTECFTRLWG